jgi:uncharacterized protein YcbK (DUF882 family)
MAQKLLEPNQKTPGAPTGVKNFKFSELEYYDRIPTELLPNAEKLLKNLQALRDACGKPITIISGYRDESRQAVVNSGVKKSQHMLAAAADIKVKDMQPKEVVALIEQLIKLGKMSDGGIGCYSDFVHFDVRCSLVKVLPGFPTTPARWNG